MKRIHQHFCLLLSVLWIFCSGCHQVVGEGEEVTQTRNLPLFDRIRIDGSYRVNIVRGPVQSIEMTTDENILPLIVTSVKNGKLIVHNLSGYTFSVASKPRIKIILKNLKTLKTTGNITAKVSGFKEDKFRLDVGDLGNVDFDSTVDNFLVRLTGTGVVDAKNASINNAEIHIDGDGIMLIRVHKHLFAHIVGGGNLTYFGKPTSIEQHVSGNGVFKQGVENGQ